MNFAKLAIAATALFAHINAFAAEPTFSGNWYFDARTVEEQKNNIECGIAEFKLIQAGDQIVGDHTYATPGCGRLNEGGEGTVSGVVVGNTAVLVVTSGRNGAMVMGKAILQGATLNWQTLQELKAGEPEGDSPLILHTGVLKREAAE